MYVMNIFVVRDVLDVMDRRVGCNVLVRVMHLMGVMGV